MDPHYNDFGSGFPDGHDDHHDVGGFNPEGGLGSTPPPMPIPDRFEDDVPYYLSQDWKGNFENRDEEEQKKKGKNDDRYAGPDYRSSSKDALGLYSAVFILTEASIDTGYKMLKSLMGYAKTAKELSHYEESYQKLLKKPEDFSVFKVEGDAMDGKTFGRIVNEVFGVKIENLETLGDAVMCSRKDQNTLVLAADKVAKNPEYYLDLLAQKDKEKETEEKDDKESGDEHGDGHHGSGNRGDRSSGVVAITADDKALAGNIAGNLEAVGDESKSPMEQAKETLKARKEINKSVGTYAANRDAISGGKGDQEEESEERAGSFSGRFDKNDEPDNANVEPNALNEDKSGELQPQPAAEPEKTSRPSRNSRNGHSRDYGATYAEPNASPLTSGNSITGSIGTAGGAEVVASSKAEAAPTESRNVGTYSKNKDALAAGQRSRVLTVSQINTKSDAKYRMDIGRDLINNTAALRTAGVSVGMTMIASTGNDDPSIQQLRGGIQKIKMARNVMDVTMFGARGEVRAAENALRNHAASMDANTWNAIGRYASPGQGGNTTSKLVDTMRRNGTLREGVGGKWNIDYKRLNNDVFGANATTAQMNALKKQLKLEERRRVGVRNRDNAVRNLKSNLVGKFSRLDDSTKAISASISFGRNTAKYGWKSAEFVWKHGGKRAISTANQYVNRFRQRQQIANARSGINSLGSAGNAIVGNQNLTGGSALVQAKGTLRARKAINQSVGISGRPKAVGKKRSLRLRQNMPNGVVNNTAQTPQQGSRISVAKGAGVRLAGRAAGTALKTARHPLKMADKLLSKAAPYRALKAGVRKVGDFFSFIGTPIRFVMGGLHKIKMFFLGLLGAYVGSLLLAYIMISLLVSVFSIFSMFISDKLEELTTPTATESIAGKVYSELRYAEISWASSIRAYGTNKNKLLVSDIKYTDQDYTLEEYLNSDVGASDYLGAFAVSDEEHKTDYLDENGEVLKGVSIGVEGPQPFDGALLNDYKLIKAIDGGNQLEIVGKPMDGWTSNAKEVVAMSAVVYQQVIENINNESSYVTGVKSVWIKIKNSWSSFINAISTWDLGLVSEAAGASTWSWSGIMRNYAYPLFINSRYEDFYLSTYIYPTYWSEPNFENGNTTSDGTAQYEGKSNSEARYDTDQEKKEQNAGDKALNDQYTKSHKSHTTTGIPKSGGSGKVNALNQVSAGKYSGINLTDAETYETGFETCYEAMTNYDINKGQAAYNGYGCQLRYTFSQKWNGSFGTDKDGNLTNKDSGITTLHYGEADEWNDPNEGDVVEAEPDPDNNNVTRLKGGQDVSADVSPYYEAEDVERGYNEDSCLVFPTEMTDRAWSCWEILGASESYFGYPEHDLDGKEWKASSARRSFSDFEDSGYRLDHIETADGPSGVNYEEGFTVWFYYPVYEVRTDENGEQHEVDISDEVGVDFVGVKVKHNCVGKHEGTYCGGHAQLRTRGVVLGFTEDQVMDGDPKEATATSKTSNFDPKFLDPDTEDLDKTKYGDATDVKGNPIEVFDIEKYSDLKAGTNTALENAGRGYAIGAAFGSMVGQPIIGGIIGMTLGWFNSGLEAAELSGIPEEDTEYVKQARDIFDIDTLIKRPKSTYPVYHDTDSSALADLVNYVSGKVGTVTWTGWTLTNMSNAISLALQDWTDMYQVPDTQTIVGGQTQGSASNHIDDDTSQNVLSQLGTYTGSEKTTDLSAEMGVNISSEEDVAELAKRYENDYPITTKTGVTISNTSELVSYINRMRHVRYALSLVGKVSYNQDMHSYLWSNLSGHQSDCSGFVSNVWRDALGLISPAGAYDTGTLQAIAESHGAWKSLSGTSIEESVANGDIKPGDIILKDATDVEGSAHALIFIGMLDENEMYADRDKEYVDIDGSGSDAQLTYATSGDGTVKAYTVDCSTMTITTKTFETNAPNKFILKNQEQKEKSLTVNKEPETDVVAGYDSMTGTNYTTKQAAPEKVRSGNVRFAARSYLQGTISGDIGYIDMDALGKSEAESNDNEVGYIADGDTIKSAHGLLIYDYSNMQKFQQEGHEDNETPYAEITKLDYASTDFNQFWSMTTSEGAKKIRNTVVLEMKEGEQADKSTGTNVEAPPLDDVEDPDPGEDIEIGDSEWVWPLHNHKKYRITSGFGTRTSPTAGASVNHKAVDIGCPIGTPVYAANDGYVGGTHYNPKNSNKGANGYHDQSGGNWVQLNHTNGFTTVYCHLTSVKVSYGQQVKKGDLIGYSGNTGGSTGPHLHFAMRINGNGVNPHNYMSW